MKKTLIFLFVGVVVMLSFSSCRKCTQCSATDVQTQVVQDETEFCGTSGDVRKWKESYTLLWDDNYTSVSCN